MKHAARILSAFLCAVLVFSAALLPASATAVSSPLPTVSTRHAVRHYLGEALGVTQESVVKWLSLHERDRYYIGTPYTDYPVGTPNGDRKFILNEKYSADDLLPAMNCAGFVSHVLCKCGLDLESWLREMDRQFPTRWREQEYDAGSANMWYLYMTGDVSGNRFVDKESGKSDVIPGADGSDVFVCYAFNDTGEALASGLLRKGDIVIYWPTEGFDHGYDGTIDSHIGFFWGNTPHSNRFWHSAGTGTNSNRITNMHPMTMLDYVLYVIPISPREETDSSDCDSYWNSRGTLALAGLDLIALGIDSEAALMPGVFAPPGFVLSDDD